MTWLTPVSHPPRLYRRVGLKSTMRGLRRELRTSLPKLNSKQRQEIIESVKTNTPLLVETEESWKADIPSRDHLEWASSIVAAFRAVTPHVETEEHAIDIITRVTRSGISLTLTGIFSRLICRTPEDSKKTVRKLITALLPQYGLPWHWDMKHGEDGGWSIQIRRCFYPQFMGNHGHPNLARAICELDFMWIDQINRRNSGIQFDQDSYQTLVRGGNQCRIPFVKVTTSVKK